MFRALLLAAALAAPLTHVAVASAPTCDVRTLSAAQIGDFYFAGGTGEVWRETNDLPGLQIRSTTCSDNTQIPADQCILRNTSTGQTIPCAQSAAAALT